MDPIGPEGVGNIVVRQRHPHREQIRRGNAEPRQPLEADMMAVVQVGQQRTDAGRGRTACQAPCLLVLQHGSAGRIRRSDRRTAPPGSLPAGSAAGRYDRSGADSAALRPTRPSRNDRRQQRRHARSLDRLGTGLSGVSASGRALPSRGGHGLLDAFPTLALPRPNLSFEGGTCELLEVLRGHPTSASSSCIRKACEVAP